MASHPLHLSMPVAMAALAQALVLVMTLTPTARLAAVEVDDGISDTIPGAVGGATLRLELLGRGLLPTARVMILNPRSEPLLLPRTWTYEVIPQRAILDERIRAAAVDADATTYSELQCLPDQRVSITLSPRRLFNDDDREPIRVAPHKGWGHDHELDLRLAKLPRNSIAFVRLVIGDPDAKSVATSDWERIQVPDVPMDLPLIRFTSDARKLMDPAFTRAAAHADAVFTATASGPRWTRVLTLDPHDPLARALPAVLLDGKSFHVFDDGVPCRFTFTGMHDGVIDTDAQMVAVMPLR